MALLHKAGEKTARLVPEPGNPHHGVTLSHSQPNLVGRKGEGELAIDDPSLSRSHATIWHQDGQWWVRDEQSLNGTFLNGNRIETAALNEGDVLSLGGEIEYRLTSSASSGGNFAENGMDGGASSSLAQLFCLGLVPEDGGRTLILKQKVTIVGRNKTCDLVLDETQVSGIHARIKRHGSQISILDSGSRNGTVVNGETVRRAVLHPGDEIVFGGSAFIVRQTFVPTGTLVAGMAATSLLVILAILLPALFRAGTGGAERLWTRDMYVSQVTESMVLALRALDDEPPLKEVARAQFAVARRSLVAADLVPLENAAVSDWNEAFQKAAQDYRVERELRNRNIYELYVSLDEPDEPVAVAEAPPVEVSVPEPSSAPEFNLERELSAMVAQFGIDTRRRPIPPEMVSEVQRFIEFWTGPKRSFTERTIKRSAAHLEMIQAAMMDHQLPEVFAYLPFIESGYQESVTSSAKARGLWQFMPSTGKAHGLRVDDEVDERTDPVKSTEAACQYLDSLLNMFGPNAFLCAVAAYNKGENGMARCLKKYGDWRSTWKFWDVAKNSEGCLKQETLEYVPRFLAAAVIMRRPEAFGF
jgi:pSer/pThr/pTyr-binding forkhead associated (FHA) protein